MTPDKFLRRLCQGLVQRDATVFITWFKTADGGWTEDVTKGDWHPWSNSPHAAMTCDIKYEQYYQVGGVRYDGFEEAIKAMEYEIFKPYLPELALLIGKRIERRKKTLQRLTFHKEVKVCLKAT